MAMRISNVFVNKKIADGKRGSHKEKKNPKVFICSTLFIVGGESQMRKCDKGKKVFGVIVILVVIDFRKESFTKETI
jgi:hypothetical protein